MPSFVYWRPKLDFNMLDSTANPNWETEVNYGEH